MRRLCQVTLVVKDYDEAIDWFRRCLQFELTKDVALGAGKRWVVVSPGGDGAEIVLAKAADDQQQEAIGRQTGGRVGFFLQTDDFDRDYDAFRKAGVTFLERPRTEPYGKVVQFADLYENKWDLIEITPAS
ncbi:MAG: VOC family protein [Pseudomonadota bacterium]